MPKSISIPEIVALCHKGISKSFDDYLNFAGEWLNRAPEYFISTKLFYTLAQDATHSTHYVTLEDNRGEVVDGAGGIEQDDKKDDMRLNGKADVIVWHSTMTNKKYRPKAIIEIKNNVSGFYKIRKDIETLISIIDGMAESEIDPIKVGAVAGYLDRGSRDRVDCRERVRVALLGIKNKTVEFANRKEIIEKQLRIDVSCSVIKHSKEDDSAWASFVITIQPPTRSK